MRVEYTVLVRIMIQTFYTKIDVETPQLYVHI